MRIGLANRKGRFSAPIEPIGSLRAVLIYGDLAIAGDRDTLVLVHKSCLGRDIAPDEISPGR